LTKILSINTGKERIIQRFDCTVCDCKFTEDEGGLQRGVIGMLPVSFCPTCFSGVMDMAEYFRDKDNKE
jgi:hypothetical protein